MSLSKLLLVRIYLIQLASHLCVTSTQLSPENVASLRGCPWLSLDGPWSVSVDLSHHLHLIWVVHDKLFGVASIGMVRSLTTRNDLALRRNGWNFVVVLLNW